MGVEAGYLNIISDFDADYFRFKYGANFANPEKLENVFTSFVDGEQYSTPQPAVISGVAKFKPDVILACGYIAALALKISVPEIPLVYLTTGCKQAQIYMQKDEDLDAISLYNDLQNLDWPPKIYNNDEKQASELADLIITHSDQTKQFYHSFFSQVEGKIHNRVFCVAHGIIQQVRKYQASSKPFSDRKVDVLFVSNDWRRTEKNYPFVAAIAAGLPDANIHIVGEIPYAIPGVTNRGIISDFKTLYDLMGDSKTLVSPSRLDAAPGILSEGAVMGCNIVASRNCGNWRLCNPNLLVEDFTPRGFIDKIKTSLTGKLPDGLAEIEAATDITELFELLKLAATIE
jgi:glycosyltransferase involved in cell wall biosynthesis